MKDYFSNKIKMQNEEVKNMKPLSQKKQQEREAENQHQWNENLENRLDSICFHDLSNSDLLSVVKFCHAMKIQAKYLNGGFDLDKQFEALHKIATQRGDRRIHLTGSIIEQMQWLKYRHPAVEYHEPEIMTLQEILKDFEHPEPSIQNIDGNKKSA